MANKSLPIGSQEDQDQLIRCKVRSGHKRDYLLAIHTQKEISASLGQTRLSNKKVESNVNSLVLEEILTTSKPRRRLLRSSNLISPVATIENDQMKAVLRKETKVPTNIEELVRIRMLHGHWVHCTTGNEEHPCDPTGSKIRGRIGNGGNVFCFCDSCNGATAFSAEEFKQHAGCTEMQSAADCICFENGNTISVLLQELHGSSWNKLESTIKRVVEEKKRRKRRRKTTNSSHNARKKEKASSSRNAKKKAKGKKKDMMLHRLVFSDIALLKEVMNVEERVTYIYKGKRLLTGELRNSGRVFCEQSPKGLSFSKFEDFADPDQQRRKPYNYIYLTNGLSLHELAIQISKSPDLTDRMGLCCTPEGQWCRKEDMQREDKITSTESGPGTCMQCNQDLPEVDQFCSPNCRLIYDRLQEQIQKGTEQLPESGASLIQKKRGQDNADVTWRLLTGKLKDADSSQMLSQALAIYHEQFNTIKDQDTGRNLIPYMVKGRKFSDRFDYTGMYCAVLTVNSIVESTALIRILGSQVAELPLVGTSSEGQGRGYFGALFKCLMSLLSALNVKHLIVHSLTETESFWARKFGFVPVTGDELTRILRDVKVVEFVEPHLMHKLVPSA